MAEDAGKTYVELRKRAEKRGAEASVNANGVSVHYRGKTKTVRTHAELDAFLGSRADEAEKAIADAAWQVDCLSQRMDAYAHRSDISGKYGVSYTSKKGRGTQTEWYDTEAEQKEAFSTHEDVKKVSK